LSIDLNGALRATSSHDLTLENANWKATGHDPYIIYSVQDRWFVGSWLLDLQIEPITGKFTPRIYIEGQKGFRQTTSREMLRIARGRYKLAIHALHRLTKIRFDPAESQCTFHVMRFLASPIPFRTFLARCLRNGETKNPGTLRDYGNLRRLVVSLARDGVAFDVLREFAPGYARWIRLHDYATGERDQLALQVAALKSRPLISVVMPVLDASAHFVDQAVKSVVGQIYTNWELCIAVDSLTGQAARDILSGWHKIDPRIKTAVLPERCGVAGATNSAFALASGEWFALLGPNDMLRENTFAQIAITIQARPDARIVYSDEDRIDEQEQRSDPYFKSDWNYDLFTATNYLKGLTVLRAEDVRQVGGMRPGFEGNEDYDLFLRVIERVDATSIVHVPEVLYHMRATSGSAGILRSDEPVASETGVKALEEHVQRIGVDAVPIAIKGTPYYRLRRRSSQPAPLVSLIIPTRDRLEVLRVCITSILEKTSYRPIEVIIVDNSSEQDATAEYFATFKDTPTVRVIASPGCFNYSALVNYGVRKGRGPIVAILDNDVEVINSEWLDEMASHACRADIGCVGAKLYYPNNTIQHAGIILGIGGVAGHSHKHRDRHDSGYFGRLLCVQGISAVTAACLVMRRSLYLATGGMDEDNLAIAFNDVDLCLRVAKLGYRNLWTPFAELYHYESYSRGYDTDPAHADRFLREFHYMQLVWGDQLNHDSHYSPHLSLTLEDFSIGA
jgi:glycosyltransferase involved in cell wall biosynthesis